MAVRPSASVIRTVKDDDPMAVGVPDSTPVDAFKVAQAGRAPSDTLHVNGATPPDAARVWEYAVPVTPDGIEVVEIAGADAATEMVSACVVVREPPSVTRIVNDATVLVVEVGVPETTPVDVFKVIPAGSAPEATAHVYVPVPPVADRGCEYPVPRRAGESDFVLIVSGLMTTIVSERVAVRPSTSVARTVNVEVPAVVGDPNSPPDELSERPAGNEPDAISHVYGLTPPVAANACV